MGTVWAGRHRVQGIDVAVKLLSAEVGDPVFHQLFRNEVEAVARLNHHRIAVVLDHGEVAPEAVEASGGRFALGTPFMVMELAPLGHLSLAKLGEWPEVRDLLLAILDGLAHAHARGVVHRDLKPANILLTERGPVLTDFGLAHALAWRGVAEDRSSAPTAELASAGTPNYMAPEQIQGMWREWGPWTDLYALGCLAWALTCGRPPFRGKDRLATLQGHLYSPVPDFKPRMAVPAQFADWVGRLLVKDPATRVQRAADAAWTLRQLGEPAAPFDAPPGDASIFEAETVIQASGPESRHPVASAAVPSSQAQSVVCVPLPAAPPASSSARSQHLLGAGLGLYGLRQIPLVDREVERGTLWSALHRAADEKAPGAVILRGNAGQGKSRLATWLCEEAHETGAATILEAVHSAAGGPRDGLGPMLARHLRCGGLDRVDVLQRLEGQRRRQKWQAPSDEAIALTELVIGSGEGEQFIRFDSPTERFVLLHRFFGRLAAERPLVLLLDDIQWSANTLAFVRYVLDRRHSADLPLLFVLTAQEESLADRPLESAALGGLRALEGVSELVVGPLAPEDRPTLVRELLGLDAQIAADVEALTDGNPLFAIQLVGGWIQQGVLKLGDTGFRLRSDASVPLPDGLQAVWSSRVAEILAGRPLPDRDALELAAILGQVVDAAEWSAACAVAGIVVSANLLDEMASSGLARREIAGTGFSFVHGLLRNSLLIQSEEGGRDTAHHLAAAQALESLGGSGGRRGRHLYTAGAFSEACDPLLAGAEAHHQAMELDLSSELLDLFEKCLDALGASANDPRRMIVLESKIGDMFIRGRFVEATELAERFESLARRAAIPSRLCVALRTRAKAARLAGDSAMTESLLTEAVEIAKETGDIYDLTRCYCELGHGLVRTGELPRARDYFERAYAFAAGGDTDSQTAQALQGLAVVARQAGDHDGARRMLTEALALTKDLGRRKSLADLQNDLGEIARLEGDLSGAESRYRSALAGYESIGSGDATLSLINLGLVLVTRGQAAEAEPLFAAAHAQFELQGRRALVAVCELGLATCAAQRQDRSALKNHWAAAREGLHLTKLVDVDVAILARQTADAVLVAGWPGIAREALELAASQWKRLGRDADATSCLKRVQDLVG